MEKIIFSLMTEMKPLKIFIFIGFLTYAEVVTSQEVRMMVVPIQYELNEDQPRVFFTAEQYFAPITEEQNRSLWPEKLTIEPVTNPNTIDQMKNKINGAWKLVHHCEGAAIPREYFVQTNLADGFYNPSLILNFNFDEKKLERIFIAPNTEVSLTSDNVIEVRTLLIQAVNYNLDNNYPLNLSFSLYVDVAYRLVRIQETNEFLIETNQPKTFYDQNKICPDGTFPKVLFVPFNYLVS